MSQSGGEIDQRLVMALAHPLRLQLLRILGERVASPSQMARLTKEPVPKVDYHTKVLVECDCVELVKTEPKRGVIEHFYRAKPQAVLGSRDWQEVPDPLRGELAAASLDAFIPQAIAALEGKTFQARKGSAFTWQQFTVDEPGWAEILRIMQDGEERIHRVQERCAERIEDPNHGTSIVVALSAFEAKGSKGQSGQ